MLGRVKEVVQGALTNADVLFHQIVSDLNVQRSSAYTPIFQVMFALGDASFGAADTEDAWGLQVCGCLPCAVGRLRLGALLKLLRRALFVQEDVPTHFDLSIDMAETGDVLAGSLTYSCDLFTEGTISRMAEHFKVWLRLQAQRPLLVTGMPVH